MAFQHVFAACSIWHLAAATNNMIAGYANEFGVWITVLPLTADPPRTSTMAIYGQFLHVF
eukprot:scaffold7852_cov66-Cyclotella_meneghiniana.AAC.4